MDLKHAQKIAQELNIKLHQVENTAKLLMEDATVPFISRYRKELTGSLDEVEVTAIRDRMNQLEELDKRREAILKSLAERELLTEELKEKIDAAETMTELEDICTIRQGPANETGTYSWIDYKFNPISFLTKLSI